MRSDIQSNENNNCNASWASVTVTPAPQPDLVADSVIPITATVNANQIFSSAISNIGAADVSGTITHLFQYDDDADHTSGVTASTTTSTIPIAANTGTVVVTNSRTFTTSGDKYIRVCADNNVSFVGTVPESNENNNCSISWTFVTVTPAPKHALVAGPVVPITASVGVAQTYISTIINIGAAGTGTGFQNLFQTSPVSDGSSGVVNYPVTSNMSALVAGGSANTSQSITFPVGTPSTMYIRACADKNGAADVNGTVPESNENNNCSISWTSVVVTPASTDGQCSDPPIHYTCLNPPGDTGTNRVGNNLFNWTWTCPGTGPGSINVSCSQPKPPPDFKED